VAHRDNPSDLMTDQQMAIQAMTAAQRILEEYLEPRPHSPKGCLIA
jgi:hypothetical protein